MEFAKKMLTELLGHEINYGHTINEAEEYDVISDAMEVYAERSSIAFVDFILEGGWKKLEQSEEWSNSEVHRTTQELFLLFIEKRLEKHEKL